MKLDLALLKADAIARKIHDGMTPDGTAPAYTWEGLPIGEAEALRYAANEIIIYLHHLAEKQAEAAEKAHKKAEADAAKAAHAEANKDKPA